MDLGPAGELLRAIDSADDLVHNARIVPLTDQARVPRADLDRAVTRVRNAAAAEGIESDEAFGPVLDRLSQITSDAPAIPLTGDVRCEREEIYDTLDQLRERVPESLKQARWAWIEAGGVVPPGSTEIEIPINED
jgi:hypothetical protein